MSARRIRIVAIGAAAALAVLVFVLVSSDAEREELEEPQEQDHGERASARRAARPSFESPDEEVTAAPAPTPPVALPAPDGSLPGRQPDPSVPLDPALRQHAQALAIPTTVMAMERGDVNHLQQVLKFFQDHRDENVVSEADIGAIEAAIACLERAPDAQEEAAELLRFGASTPLAKGLRKACGVR